jgi:hypothetical protein
MRELKRWLGDGIHWLKHWFSRGHEGRAVIDRHGNFRQENCLPRSHSPEQRPWLEPRSGIRVLDDKGVRRI